MLVFENGPFDLFLRLRIKTGILYDENFVVSYPNWNPLICMWCTSLYVVPIIFLCWYYLPILAVFLAITAVVGIIYDKTS